MSPRSILSYLFAFALLQACSDEATRTPPKPAPLEEQVENEDEEKPDGEKPGDEDEVAVTISVSPTTASLTVNGTQTFTATVVGADDTAVTWTVVEAAGGSITAAGVYTAPGAAGTYHVTATSKADTTKSATATISVTDPANPTVSVVVSPGSGSVLFGEQINFSAVVNNTADQNVTWSVDENNGGSINANTGVYTAPNNAGTFTVRATSDADNTKSDTALVTVSAPPAPLIEVWVSPRTAAIYPGDTIDFNVDVTNANNQVSWTATGGAINNGGTYTAGNTPGTFTVTATSDHDAAAFDQITVTILVPTFNVHITPMSASVETGGTTTFSATVDANTFGNPVTWYSTAGNIGGNGGFTAPLTVGPVQIVATSKDDTTKKATITVNVVAASPVITITPLGSQVPETDSTYAYTVVVSNSIWNRWTVALREGDAGSLSTSSGAGSGVVLYTTPKTEGTYHIDAMTVNTPTQTASAEAVVGAPHPFVNLSPLAITIETASDFDFAGDVTGSNHDGFEWSVVSADGGFIDQDGYYVAPVTAGNYIIKIASTKTDAFKTATVNVYQKYCPAGAKDIVFSSQGPDLEWDAGLDDDATLSYTRYYYGGAMAWTTLTYSQLGGGFHLGAAQNVTMAVEYTDPGPDGVWSSTDDVVTGVWKVKYNGSNRVESYAQMVTGADGILGTADDVMGPGAAYTSYMANAHGGTNPSRIKHFTSMTGPTLQESEIYRIEKIDVNVQYYCNNWMGCQNKWVFDRHIYDSAGDDGSWDSGDDVQAYYEYFEPTITWDNYALPTYRSTFIGNKRFDQYTDYSNTTFVWRLRNVTYNMNSGNYGNVTYSPYFENNGSDYLDGYEADKQGNRLSQSRMRLCPY